MKTLLGLLDFESGSCRVLGLDASADRVRVRQRIGYSPECDCLIPGLSAVEATAYCASLCGLNHRDAMRRSSEALDLCGLGEERLRDVAGLSTGMRQKVKIAQALAHGPKLVFLDEPTNGLDPNGRAEMLDLIASLPAAGVSVVLSTHILADVERTCEQVIVLSGGRVLRHATLDEMRRGGLGAFRTRIKGDGAAFRAAVARHGGTASEGDGGLNVSLPAGTDESVIMLAAAEAGVQVRLLESRDLTLEDAFVRAVGNAGMVS
jgi:ABC-2 type transport system ATP-binding protein